MGGYERHSGAVGARRARRRRDPGRLQRPPARGGLGALRGDHRQRPQARAGDGRGHDHEADQRARGVHARRRVLPRRVRRARLLRRRRLQRPRARRRGRDGQADGRVDRRGRAVARRLGDGHPPLRRALPLARLHAQAHARGLRDLLRHQVPRPRAPVGAPAARLAGLRLARAATARAFGEKSGWERVNWYEANAAAGDEDLRPRGWAGRHWSPAIGAEHAATREAAALFDETSFAKLEVSGPGAAELLEGLCDNRVVRGPGKVTYTQMLNRRGGIECDFTVTQLSEDRFWIVTGTAFGTHDRAWISLARRRGRAGRGRHLALGLRRAVGPEGARHPRAVHARSARLRLHERPLDRRRRRPRARDARHLRGRAGVGALLPDGVRQRALAHAVGGGRAARPRRGRLPRDRLAAAREGLPRVGRGHHGRRHAVRGRRSGSRSSATRPSSGATRSTTSPRGGSAASCSPTRARWRSATSRCARAGRSAGA